MREMTRDEWCVVRGAWCVVRGAWCVVRGALGWLWFETWSTATWRKLERRGLGAGKGSQSPCGGSRRAQRPCDDSPCYP